MEKYATGCDYRGEGETTCGISIPAGGGAVQPILKKVERKRNCQFSHLHGTISKCYLSCRECLSTYGFAANLQDRGYKKRR